MRGTAVDHGWVPLDPPPGIMHSFSLVRGRLLEGARAHCAAGHQVALCALLGRLRGSGSGLRA